MADTNPSNFANLSKERVQEIASMGGKASHGSDDKENDKNEHEHAGRREDGTFVPGSDAAKEAGHVGGLHAQGKEAPQDHGRHDDGTFMPGSEAAKEAGHKGGLSAASN